MAAKIKQEFLDVFIEESLPLADQVGAAALRCEDLWKGGGTDISPLRGMRAALHTVKGNAGMVGFSGIAAFVHAMEDAVALIEGPGRHHEGSARLLVEAADLLAAMVRSPQDSVIAARAQPLIARLENPEQTATKPAPIEDTKAAEVVDAPKRDESGGASAADAGRTVRVDFRLLDGLLDGLGEAMSFAGALTSLRARCAGVDPALAEELELKTDLLFRELRGLRRLVTHARLVPIGPTFVRFAQMTRSLARDRGLSVRWVERGSETMVDKAILDRLGEPLLHVLRNAIAHGIEPADQRRAKGKPEQGTIEIEARLDRERLRITIADDGRGIDVQAVKRSAAARGVAVADLTHAQLLRLVFQPGLTTTTSADALSGRGVGLDAVEMVVRELDGSIQVESKLGHGTRFELTLPTRATLLSGLVFSVGAEEYTIATQHVVETVEVANDSLLHVNGHQVFAWRELLPTVDARDLLELRDRDALQPRRCIVLEVGGERCGLLVGDVTSRVEGLVKSLDSAVCYSPTIAGATILPNGKVLPILDARTTMGFARTPGRMRFAEAVK